MWLSAILPGTVERVTGVILLFFLKPLKNLSLFWDSWIDISCAWWLTALEIISLFQHFFLFHLWQSPIFIIRVKEVWVISLCNICDSDQDKKHPFSCSLLLPSYCCSYLPCFLRRNLLNERIYTKCISTFFFSLLIIVQIKIYAECFIWPLTLLFCSYVAKK